MESCEVHSHHQNGEVLRGKTARGRWNKQNAIVGLAKCDLMTNLSTAMLSVPQWLALPQCLRLELSMISLSTWRSI